MESQSKTKNMIHVTTSSWDVDILKSDLPVFVDFLGRVVWPLQNGGPARKTAISEHGRKLKVAN